MFEELLETQPVSTGAKNRKSYFIVSSAVLGIGLVSALIFSLFAVDLNLDLNDLDMVELIAPVDAPREEKRPELEALPKTPAKAQPGPASAPVVTTRRESIARIDESPAEVPTVASTTPAAQKAVPTDRFYKIGEFDNDAGTTGVSGRGPGGTGDGEGGLGDGTVAMVETTNAVPPPPPAAPRKRAVEKPVVKSLGVVNGRATRLPKPAIPATAKSIDLSGTVSVQVLIDESGNVISANAVSGHILLRDSSEAAARSAKFAPTLLSGTPVKASGVIYYHFS